MICCYHFFSVFLVIFMNIDEPNVFINIDLRQIIYYSFTCSLGEIVMSRHFIKCHVCYTMAKSS